MYCFSAIDLQPHESNRNRGGRGTGKSKDPETIRIAFEDATLRYSSGCANLIYYYSETRASFIRTTLCRSSSLVDAVDKFPAILLSHQRPAERAVEEQQQKHRFLLIISAAYLGNKKKCHCSQSIVEVYFCFYRASQYEFVLCGCCRTLLFTYKYRQCSRKYTRTFNRNYYST